MKTICLTFLTLNVILFSYLPIKRYTLAYYAEQYSKWDIYSKLNDNKFILEKLFVSSYFKPSPTNIVNLNFIKSIGNLEVNSMQFNTVDSIINEYLQQLAVLYPDHILNIRMPNFDFNQYLSEFIPILNKLSILSISDYAFGSSYGTGFCGLDRIQIIKIPNGRTTKKYSIFCLESTSYEYESTYLLIGKDTISDQLTNIYKLSSPIDSTTLIYKYVKLYGEKDSLISTYKTKIIELD
ncbi:MAG: hypothetical protein IPK88_06630 [Saprospiraceae bacterium]|nr:hypothetical protein [Candidatus Defluviibacterium haderslevense]